MIAYCFYLDAEIVGIPSAEVDHIKSYIRNHPSERILLSTLPSNLKRKYSKEQYLPILQQLEIDGHGAVTTADNTTGPKAIVFIKKQRITVPTEPTSSVLSSSVTSSSSSSNTIVTQSATTITDPQSTIINNSQ